MLTDQPGFFDRQVLRIYTTRNFLKQLSNAYTTKLKDDQVVSVVAFTTRYLLQRPHPSTGLQVRILHTWQTTSSMGWWNMIISTILKATKSCDMCTCMLSADGISSDGGYCPRLTNLYHPKANKTLFYSVLFE